MCRDDSRAGGLRIYGLLFYGLRNPLGRIGRRDEIVALRRPCHRLPLAAAAAQAELHGGAGRERNHAQRDRIGPQVVVVRRYGNQPLQAVGRSDLRGTAVGVLDAERHFLVAGLARSEERIGERQPDVVFVDRFEGDALGRAVERVVALVAYRNREPGQFREGQDPVFLLPGNVFLDFGDVEPFADDGRIGAEDDFVVLVVGTGVDADQHTVDITGQIGRIFEREGILAAGFDIGDVIFHFHVLTLDMRSAEEPGQRRHACGQGVITRPFGREPERRDAARFGGLLVDLFPAGDPYGIAGGEVLEDRIVEFHLYDGVHDLADDRNVCGFAGFDGERLLALV